jgi:nucleoside-diphosphate-sugar epimerase
MADEIRVVGCGEVGTMRWDHSRVLVTGGASFIGSALVDALVERGARVRVIDNLSSGKLENLKQHLKFCGIEFQQNDLLEPSVVRQAVAGMDIVFHLAADHGGRGYVSRHQADCASNLILDGQVFRACARAGVRKVVYASSGCVYPNFLQTNPHQVLRLSEDKAGPPFDADNMYGWANVMAEQTLLAYHREFGLRSVSCRYFTVYGERAREQHSVIAMIARAFLKQDPFVVWGDGEQVRDWTYVADIVEGTIRAAEVVDDASCINLGTTEGTRVRDAAEEILRYSGHRARIELHPEMPTGPMNRVADTRLARERLGWEPRVKFIDGLHRTIDWYFRTKQRDQVEAILGQGSSGRVSRVHPETTDVAVTVN